MGWRLLSRGKALHLPFSIHSRRLRKGEESNWEEGESLDSKHSGRWAGGFFLAEKALHLPFSIHSRRLRKEEKSNWEDDGPNQAVRCIWQRSTLRWPTQYAASAIARRCVFGDRLMPAGALFLSIPALQRSKGVARRANGHVHLPPKRKLKPCTRTFLTSYLPEALHHPTFPTLCKTAAERQWTRGRSCPACKTQRTAFAGAAFCVMHRSTERLRMRCAVRGPED